MFASNCIDNSIPFLRLSDSAFFALELMQEFKVDLLAVVDNEIFLGSIAENVLLEMEDTIIIKDIQSQLEQHKINDTTHLFDILKKCGEENQYFYPVTTPENEYVGLITPKKLIEKYTQYSALASTGGILILEVANKDYSLTEISKIVELNNAVILHCAISNAVQENFLHVSLKINKNDLKDIQLTFERYKYNVIAVIHQSEYELQLQDRYDSLMKYLEL